MEHGTTRATPMRRVAIASCAGTTIEFYDFFIYGTAAALVFPTVFFPALGSAAATVASFATFAVAFVARPVGAILFGHYGDRLGRKNTLIATLVLMGVSTVVIGLLPGAATIGVAAPIILVVLRFLQGLAVGGEWAGATLLAAEYAPPGRRGLYAIFPQMGPALAFALSSATFLAVNVAMGDTNPAFLEWGWRIPFLLSIVLVGVGLWVRLTIDETPAFRRAQAAGTLTTARTSPPILEVFRVQPREILLSGGVLTIVFALFYMGTAFLTSYGTSATGAGLDRRTVLILNIVAAVVFGAVTAVSGIVSDRFGRRNVILACCALSIPWALVLFPIMGTGSGTGFAIGLIGTLAIFGIAYGPVGAYMPEMFATRYRYTGAGMGYNLGGVLGGAVSPLLAAQLSGTYGSYAVGLMLAGFGLLSLVCVLALGETSRRVVDAETEDAPRQPADGISSA
ncbi:MFS transporter [Pseudonocardia broussonetiae]|uniref:MHS family MFS transporter n=1 Tax=Pseudonocardia broussonetiae TaxID=2736640 RepID=A0A6M6JTV9_9PSEU|nr:MFS transporter [Pseudonocardia broussonetiae]QJY49621.1 MHS family MFS transporter [Pseudonocardia broussonetiae]